MAYLDRLREIETSERMTAGERDGWILLAARWPGKVLGDAGRDDVSLALLDNLADASDKRAERLRDLMRERGWDSWLRMRRLSGPGDATSQNAPRRAGT